MPLLKIVIKSALFTFSNFFRWYFRRLNVRCEGVNFAVIPNQEKKNRHFHRKNETYAEPYFWEISLRTAPAFDDFYWRSLVLKQYFKSRVDLRPKFGVLKRLKPIFYFSMFFNGVNFCGSSQKKESTKLGIQNTMIQFEYNSA